MGQFGHLYKTKKWQRMRRVQLDTHPLCAYCKEKGELKEASIADHKRPHRGDVALFYDPKNLQSLCKLCHDSAKKIEEFAPAATDDDGYNGDW